MTNNFLGINYSDISKSSLKANVKTQNEGSHEKSSENKEKMPLQQLEEKENNINTEKEIIQNYSQEIDNFWKNYLDLLNLKITTPSFVAEAHYASNADKFDYSKAHRSSLKPENKNAAINQFKDVSIYFDENLKSPTEKNQKINKSP